MPHWKKVAAAHIARRDALFPSEWIIPADQLPDASVKNVLPLIPHFLTTRETLITNTLAHQIVQHIVSGIWTAEEVTRSFCHRATIAHQLTNCLTEVFFAEAIARAKELDAYFAKTGKTVGPLHGLPISLKDQFNVAGVPCSMGYVGYVDRIPKGNSILAQALLDAGAVLYCRTNVSMALMMFNALNNLFGETVHPANRDLTPSGSSGGEGALVLSGGSPLGVGTDIGGSIRDPASWCGLYAMRPSHGRVPYEGAENSMFGQEAIRSSAGPLTRSVADVKLFMEAVVGQGTWVDDPQVLPIPWRNIPVKGKYAFGIILDDGRTAYHPPVKRAMKLVLERLRANGHQVLEVEPYDLARAHDLANRLYGADGGKEMKRALDLSGEPWLPAIEKLAYYPEEEISALQFWDLTAERDVYLKEFSDWWKETNKKFEGGVMDGLLCAGLPSTAMPLDIPEISPWESTSFLVPLLQYTAGVVPVLQCDKAIDKKDERFIPKDDFNRQWWEMYDPEKMHGGWFGVQVVGRRLEEEKVLNMMESLDEALKA